MTQRHKFEAKFLLRTFYRLADGVSYNRKKLHTLLQKTRVALFTWLP